MRPACGQYNSNTCTSREEAVGEPGEGKPRHYLSLDLPVVPDLEWRGFPLPGFPTIIHRLFFLFEWHSPRACRCAHEITNGLRNDLPLLSTFSHSTSRSKH